jgi:hypothetical protein
MRLPRFYKYDISLLNLLTGGFKMHHTLPTQYQKIMRICMTMKVIFSSRINPENPEIEIRYLLPFQISERA